MEGQISKFKDKKSLLRHEAVNKESMDSLMFLEFWFFKKLKDISQGKSKIPFFRNPIKNYLLLGDPICLLEKLVEIFFTKQITDLVSYSYTYLKWNTLVIDIKIFSGTIIPVVSITRILTEKCFCGKFSKTNYLNKRKLIMSQVLNPEVSDHIYYLYWIYSILPNLCR